MVYSYPILQKILESQNQESEKVRDYYLVCCQHILAPQLRMFKTLTDFGFDPTKMFVLGKAYSTNDEIAENVKALGITVFNPIFSGNSFDEEHKLNCQSVLQKIPENIEHLIILDDGGELIKTFAEDNRKVSFAVEQTSSGFRKLEVLNTQFPIINVARSAIKLMQESPLIARHAFERIEKYLQDNNVDRPKILVVGLGPIGEAFQKVLKEKEYSVAGFDISHGHTDLLKAIEDFEPNMIVGATGVQILTKEDIEKMSDKSQVHLVSLSSSDREFPVIFYRSKNRIHEDVRYKNITFVNNGFPITFKGNQYELTAVQAEKTVALLAGSIIFGLTEGVSGSGIVNVPGKLDQLILEASINSSFSLKVSK